MRRASPRRKVACNGLGIRRGSVCYDAMMSCAIALIALRNSEDGFRSQAAVLGHAEGVEGYHDITRYPDARQEPGLVLFRWDAPLFFANAELFKERVLDAAANSPTPVRWLVVAAEPVTSVDVTAADVLAELHQALDESGIALRFAELKDPVKDKLRRFGLLTQFGEDCFFPTIEVAIDNYLRLSPLQTETAKKVSRWATRPPNNV
jgi:MFS superfamily sulfate permease-like transporter